MTSRRSFLNSIIAAAAAPAIVKAEIIMPVRRTIIAPTSSPFIMPHPLFGDIAVEWVELPGGVTHIRSIKREQWEATSRQIIVEREPARPGRGASIEVLEMPR